jgi:uncharacterized membrane protein YkvI
LRLRLTRILSLACVEIGALVGGGFASGREVHEFFAQHGPGGRVGIVLFALLIAVLGGVFLEAARRGGTHSYRELTVRLAGRRVADLADPLVALALFLGLAVTIAGSGALVSSLGLGSRLVGIGAASIVAGLIAWRGPRGVIAANVAIVPALGILVVVVAGLPALHGGPAWHLGLAALTGAAGRASVLYFLYNGLLAVVLFASLGGQARDGADGWLAALLAAVVLGLLALAIYDALWRHPGVATAEIPLLALAARGGAVLRSAYVLALAGALLTTAVGNAFGLFARLGGRHGDGRVLVAIVAAGAALALVGFAPLVRYGYRLVAVAGAAYLAALGVASLGRLSRGGARLW